jgi:hypothetical protein
MQDWASKRNFFEPFPQGWHAIREHNPRAVWMLRTCAVRVHPFVGRSSPRQRSFSHCYTIAEVKRRNKLAGPSFGEWRREEKIDSLLSRDPDVRDCPCGGSNENCSLCNGLGVITSTPKTAPLGPPKADLRVCDKCEFRGSASELEKHRAQHHLIELTRCIRCRFEGTAAELEAHWLVAHRGRQGGGKAVEAYVCDSCEFRGPLFSMEKHVRSHDVDRTISSCIHLDEEVRSIICPVCHERISRKQIHKHFNRSHRAYSQGLAMSLGLGFHRAPGRAGR